MPVDMRYRLLNWASEGNRYIIEDDYDSQLRYHSRPIPSLYSLCTDDRVIYIGTFSKSLSPAIRISYLVLPRRLAQDAGVAVYSIGDCFADPKTVPDNLILIGFGKVTEDQIRHGLTLLEKVWNLCCV